MARQYDLQGEPRAMGVISLAKIVELGLIDEDCLTGVVQANLTLGANSACTRRLDGTGVPCVLYLRTSTGVLGTGAHAGFVVEVDEDTLLALGYRQDAILFAAGARAAVGRDRYGAPCCADCAIAGEEKLRRRKSRRVAQKPCFSCATMIRESWERNLIADGWQVAS